MCQDNVGYRIDDNKAKSQIVENQIRCRGADKAGQAEATRGQL